MRAAIRATPISLFPSFPRCGPSATVPPPAPHFPPTTVAAASMGPTAPLVAAAAVVAAALPALAAAACAGSPTYRVTWAFAWTASTHPGAYVPSAHFSPVNVAAHTPAYTMWLTAALATPGMRDVAETGSTAALEAELATYQAAGYVASSAVGPPGAVPPRPRKS
eukprot:TRINITY_DN4815_c0_g1_i1.p3 TRINITY_DN4815_c0_g1~~TRINITY_DN4815_c0_g1_i1.p3  ORF type:complete len:165 (+),score=41.73 TRINITY_DN4815_c0_g1_i1:1-495(+)